MGGEYPESPAARSECTSAETKTRVRHGRFTFAVRASLVALGICTAATTAGADTLTELSRFAWQFPAINGVSGLEVTDDGKRFIAVTDLGWRLEGEIARDGDAIFGVAVTAIDPIRSKDTLPVAARRVGDWSDAEGLAIASDGTEYVSFERWARVATFDGPNSPAKRIKDHPTFFELASNRQLEAIAIDSQGTIVTFPERPLESGFPIFQLKNGAWSVSGYLPEADGFSIVGADFDRGDKLYLLERKLQLGTWWRSRIRRVNLDGTEDVALWTSERDQFTNLEGISVWYDDQGLRLTLVSDNNRSTGEPTEFVEFRLTE